MSKTGRNAGAVAAQFRNSAGSMRDKRESRGGASNDTRDLLAEVDGEREPEEVSLNDLAAEARAEELARSEMAAEHDEWWDDSAAEDDYLSNYEDFYSYDEGSDIGD